MQALQFEGRAVALGQLQDGRHRGGVVRGELRVDGIGMPEQGLGTGKVGDVGVVLVREHRVGGQAQLLRAFNFAVPVGAFHEPHHEDEAVRAGDACHLVHALQRARLVGLDGQAQAAPVRAARRNMRRGGVDEGERKLEPLAFLGVEGEVDVGLGRVVHQTKQARQQLGENALALRLFVTREKGGELDGDAVARPRPRVGARLGGRAAMLAIGQGWGRGRMRLGACPAEQRRGGLHLQRCGQGGLRLQRCGRGAGGDGGQRVAVGPEVAQRILLAARAFAEHVEREMQAGVGAPLRPGFGQRFMQGLAEYELPPEQRDGARRCGDHRLRAQAAQKSAWRFALRQELARQREHARRQAGQMPRRGALGLRGVARHEVGAPELVGRERDRRFGVGHPQQRFGQPHQGQAFGARDGKVAQQGLQRPKRRGLVAHRAHPRPRALGRRRPVELAAQGGKVQSHHGGLLAQRRRQPGQGGCGRLRSCGR